MEVNNLNSEISKHFWHFHFNFSDNFISLISFHIIATSWHIVLKELAFRSMMTWSTAWLDYNIYSQCYMIPMIQFQTPQLKENTYTVLWWRVFQGGPVYISELVFSFLIMLIYMGVGKPYFQPALILIILNPCSSRLLPTIFVTPAFCITSVLDQKNSSVINEPDSTVNCTRVQLYSLFKLTPT